MYVFTVSEYNGCNNGCLEVVYAGTDFELAKKALNECNRHTILQKWSEGQITQEWTNDEIL